MTHYSEQSQALNKPFNCVTADSLNCAAVNSGGRIIQKLHTFDGNGAQTDNLFSFSGPIRIMELYSSCKEATDLSGATVGDLYIKEEDSEALQNLDSSQCRYTEDTVGGIFNTTYVGGITIPKNGATTYIRASFTGDADTDVDLNIVLRYAPVVCGEYCVVAEV